MNNVEIRVVEKTKSSYQAHLLNADAHLEFSFNFNLAEKQKLQDVMDGISHGDADAGFEANLKNYGNKLYCLLFSSEVGKEFEKLRKGGFCLRLYLPPILEALPWEYLADEGDFLFKGIENFLIRVSSLEEKAVLRQKISPPVKVLVIISNPPDLPEDRKLDVIREKRLIKEALRPLIDEGRLAVRWEDEASLEKIHDVLLEFNPHIIHYTGHGGFDEENGGVLLLEDGRDKSLNVSGAKLADLLAGRDVRLIVLSGCQTAMTKATDSFSSVAGALVKKGIPSVIAMQQSIRDASANIFASRFYKALAGGQAVDAALGEARLSMRAPRSTRENPTPHSLIDWGIPVLISSAHDLNLFATDAAAPLPAKPAPKGFSKVNLPNPGDIFVGRQKEQRQIARALRGGDARCIMILGPGGIGKSSLAARAVEQSEEYFHAVLTIGCKTAPSAEQILLEINFILKKNENTKFDQIMQDKDLKKISQKIEYLPQALNAFSNRRYLIIFDNFENMLDVTKEPHAIKDADVRYLLETLTVNLRGSRVLITSRQDFDFTTDRRFQGSILPVPLRELTKMEAFMLMENIPSLSNTIDSKKLLIYEKGGGNPFILDLVAAASRAVPVGNVLADIENIQNKFVEETLLNKLYEWLPDDETRKFFRRASIYRKPVIQDFLVAMGGSDERIGYLLHKSLLTRIAGDMYEMHTSTSAFAYERLKQIDGDLGLREAQITAAQMYYNVGKEGGNVEDCLESRWFYYSAEEYNKAGVLVGLFSELLLNWGFIEKVIELNEETVKSATDEVKASALHNLGVILQEQGRNDEAMEMLYESLKIRRELGNISGIAEILNEFGLIYLQRGRYKEAVKMFQGSLKINKELDIIGLMDIPKILHNLAVVYQYQGQYDEAIKILQESLKIRRKMKDECGAADDLQELGAIHYRQRRYEEAAKMYQESLKIYREHGVKKGVASALHNLGAIYADKGMYDEAISMYQKSLKISEELEYVSGIADTLQGLGKIHSYQGNYNEALEMYKKSWEIYEKLRDKRGTANIFLEMGNVHKEQGRYEEALRMYQECLKINKELEEKNGVADALHGLGNIHYLQGRYEEAIEMYQKGLKIKEELEDKRGMSTILYLLGIIYQDQGRYDESVKMFEESLKIDEELGNKNGIVNTSLNLGRIYQDQGRYDEAIKMYQKSLNINEKIGNKIGIASNLGLMGMVYQDQGRYAEAAKMYQKSLKICKELEGKSGISSNKVLLEMKSGMTNALGWLEKTFQDQGKYDEAAKMFQEGMKISEELNDKKGFAEALNGLGNVHYLQGRHDEAVKMYQESLKIGEELDDKSSIAGTLYNLGNIFYIQKNYKEALRNFLLAFGIFDELNSPDKDLVGQDITKLKEEIGERQFNKYYKEIVANEQRDKDSN